jgi:hypothetical protein
MLPQKRKQRETYNLLIAGNFLGLSFNSDNRNNTPRISVNFYQTTRQHISEGGTLEKVLDDVNFLTVL